MRQEGEIYNVTIKAYKINDRENREKIQRQGQQWAQKIEDKDKEKPA